MSCAGWLQSTDCAGLNCDSCQLGCPEYAHNQGIRYRWRGALLLAALACGDALLTVQEWEHHMERGTISQLQPPLPGQQGQGKGKRQRTLEELAAADQMVDL